MSTSDSKYRELETTLRKGDIVTLLDDDIKRPCKVDYVGADFVNVCTVHPDGTVSKLVHRRPLTGVQRVRTMPPKAETEGELTWRNQFPEDVAVPDEIQKLVASGIIEDVSWGNDAMPSFELHGLVDSQSVTYRVWVDYPDLERREFPANLVDGGPTLRFAIIVDDEKEPNSEPLLQTDDLEELLAAIKTIFFAEYVASGGTTGCPWPDCKASELEGVDCHNEDYITRTIRCNACGREFDENYTMTSVILVSPVRQFTRTKSEEGCLRYGLLMTMAFLLLLPILALGCSAKAQQATETTQQQAGLVPCDTDTDCLEKNGDVETKEAFYCGALTKAGKPCKHRVKHKGDRCWQHKP